MNLQFFYPNRGIISLVAKLQIVMHLLSLDHNNLMNECGNSGCRGCITTALCSVP